MNSEQYESYINKRYIHPFTFTDNFVTAYKCSYCNNGMLASENNKIQLTPTAESKKDRLNPEWDYEWGINYHFSANLICKNCGETTYCIGDANEQFYCDDEYSTEVYSLISLTPLYFNPTVHLFEIDDRTPNELKQVLISAFSIAFTDKASAANKIRTCIETYIKIINPSANQKFLHDRIQTLKESHKNVCDVLTAIKWIGNQGSHEENISECDLAFAFEAIKYCIDETFCNRIYHFSKVINTIKRPILRE